MKIDSLEIAISDIKSDLAKYQGSWELVCAGFCNYNKYGASLVLSEPDNDRYIIMGGESKEDDRPIISQTDAEFIAKSLNLLPQLIERHEQIKAELQDLTEKNK